MEIRRSYDRLISTMGFPILVRCHLYIESGPWFSLVFAMSGCYNTLCLPSSNFKRRWYISSYALYRPRDDIMKMSSNGNIFRVIGHCAGNSLVTGEFPAQRPVTRSFGVFFDLRPIKRLSKQSWGWWFETQSRSLWPHGNDIAVSFDSLPGLNDI